MRRLLQFSIAVAIFSGGIAPGAVWHSRRIRNAAKATSSRAQRTDEKPWPLNKQIVVRSLQSHSFRTEKLQTNSTTTLCGGG